VSLSSLPSHGPRSLANRALTAPHGVDPACTRPTLLTRRPSSPGRNPLLARDPIARRNGPRRARPLRCRRSPPCTPAR
jgi:hypothetical protein